MGGGLIYWTYLKYLSDDQIDELPSWLDMLPVIVIMINRCCVISIKYGYYSDQHYNLKRKIKFDLDFLIHDLISITLHDFEVKKLRKRIIASLKNLGIQESQFYIECSKN